MRAWVAAIVIAHGSERDTEECLDALCLQSYPSVLVIVVNNGGRALNLRLSAEMRLRVIRIDNDENRGYAAACNQGIRRAMAESCEYAWVINNDTKPDPSSLASLVEKARCEPLLGAIGSVLLNSDRSIQAWGGGRVSSCSGLPTHFREPVSPERIGYLCAASIFLPVNSLRSVGGFDEEFFLYWEDTDLSYRMRRAGWGLAVAEQARVVHKGSSSTGFQSPFYDYWFTRSSIRFFRKHLTAWYVPAAISTAGRAIKRLGRFQPANAAAVLKGFLQGTRLR